MSSSLMSMPILIYNLGVEMVYVLCSRLKAQNIAPEKSVKVIHDVVASLFEKKFLEEIQKKQEISKHSAVRQIFEKLAHSSIMRLNTSSMNKLFDLMLMSFKLQLMRIKFPEEILQITLNHLNSLHKILVSSDNTINKDIIQIVKDSIAYTEKNYSCLNPFEFIILRQTLYRFFQGKNVKVSIFIQDNYQSNTGVIYLPMTETAPPSVKVPGHVEYIDPSGKKVKEEFLNHPYASIYKIYDSDSRVGIKTTELGNNVYPTEKKNTKNDENVSNTVPATDMTDEFKNVTQTSQVNNSSSPTKNISSGYLQNTKEREKNIANVKTEFNQLADMICTKNYEENQTFKLDLFGDMRSGNFKSKTSNQKDQDDDYIDLNRDDNLENAKNMFNDMNLENEDDEEDLLELMDKASKK